MSNRTVSNSHTVTGFDGKIAFGSATRTPDRGWIAAYTGAGGHSYWETAAHEDNRGGNFWPHDHNRWAQRCHDKTIHSNQQPQRHLCGFEGCDAAQRLDPLLSGLVDKVFAARRSSVDRGITDPAFTRKLNMLPRAGANPRARMLFAIPLEIKGQAEAEARASPDAEDSTRRPALIGVVATALLILLASGAVQSHHGRVRGELAPVKWHAVRISTGSVHGPRRIGTNRPSCLDTAIRGTIDD
jgi:hypothetical protein